MSARPSVRTCGRPSPPDMGWSPRTRRGDHGRVVNAIAPLGRLPLYVRAGIYFPTGPDEEWATQKAADPIELRIYQGANGDFTLYYEDENDNYDYEKGSYATIPLHWDDASHTLTIGDRKGKFPGMIESRAFQVVFLLEKTTEWGSMRRTRSTKLFSTQESRSV